jgi:hypothetical protein
MLKEERTMTDHARIVGILNAYRDEIKIKSPKSYLTWQKNRTVMPAGVGSLFRLADPFPMVIKKSERCQGMGRRRQ